MFIAIEMQTINLEGSIFQKFTFAQRKQLSDRLFSECNAIANRYYFLRQIFLGLKYPCKDTGLLLIDLHNCNRSFDLEYWHIIV